MNAPPIAARMRGRVMSGVDAGPEEKRQCQRSLLELMLAMVCDRPSVVADRRRLARPLQTGCGRFGRLPGVSDRPTPVGRLLKEARVTIVTQPQTYRMARSPPGRRAGGWTLAAAEQICTGDGIAEKDVLDLLASLRQFRAPVMDWASLMRSRLLDVLEEPSWSPPRE